MQKINQNMMNMMMQMMSMMMPVAEGRIQKLR